MEDVSVVVLAGGKGTRLRGLFPDVPKPLVPVAGQPFLYWLTNWIAAHGPRHFVFSTGYMAEQIEAWARDGQMPGIERSCCREEVPLGTGGGLLNWAATIQYKTGSGWLSIDTPSGVGNATIRVDANAAAHLEPWFAGIMVLGANLSGGGLQTATGAETTVVGRARADRWHGVCAPQRPAGRARGGAERVGEGHRQRRADEHRECRAAGLGGGCRFVHREPVRALRCDADQGAAGYRRSEEHTSELQS
mgnify:CR=1 FL=1